MPATTLDPRGRPASTPLHASGVERATRPPARAVMTACSSSRIRAFAASLACASSAAADAPSTRPWRRRLPRPSIATLPFRGLPIRSCASRTRRAARSARREARSARSRALRISRLSNGSAYQSRDRSGGAGGGGTEVSAGDPLGARGGCMVMVSRCAISSSGATAPPGGTLGSWGSRWRLGGGRISVAEWTAAGACGHVDGGREQVVACAGCSVRVRPAPGAGARGSLGAVPARPMSTCSTLETSRPGSTVLPSVRAQDSMLHPARRRVEPRRAMGRAMLVSCWVPWPRPYCLAIAMPYRSSGLMRWSRSLGRLVKMSICTQRTRPVNSFCPSGRRHRSRASASPSRHPSSRPSRRSSAPCLDATLRPPCAVEEEGDGAALGEPPPSYVNSTPDLVLAGRNYGHRRS